MNLFNAATRVILEDGHKASFPSSSWLHGQSLHAIALQIFEVSKRKKVGKKLSSPCSSFYSRLLNLNQQFHCVNNAPKIRGKLHVLLLTFHWLQPEWSMTFLEQAFLSTWAGAILLLQVNL
jgi:hypothetical protein